MPPALLKTPLYDWHAAHGGRMVEFGGWSMPVQYTSIVEEHHATRRAVGLFDISHMGRLRFDGPGANCFLDALVTRRVDNLAPWRIRYSLLTNDAGGILDDILVYRLADSDGREYHLLVVNAGNRLKVVDWIERRLKTVPNVTMTDLSIPRAMIAVQGPSALAVMRPLVDIALPPMKYYSAANARIGSTAGLVSRTGYTGEDGVELIVPAGHAQGLWEEILSAGRSAGAVPAGLGARDTLRLEAAMPLYGHELSEQITPYQAGLEFAVDLAGRRFPGSEALAVAHQRRDVPRRVGLRGSAGRVPREGCPVLKDGAQIGDVTSGTFSPTLDCPIAMAYVAPSAAVEGTEVSIDIRGRQQGARIVALPFYTRAK